MTDFYPQRGAVPKQDSPERQALRLIESGAFTRRLSDWIAEADSNQKARMIARAGLNGDADLLSQYRDALEGSA